MKFKFLTLAVVFTSGLLTAQEINETLPSERISYNALGQKVITSSAIGFQKTAPIKDWPQKEDTGEKDYTKKTVRKNFDAEAYAQAKDIETIDPVVQSEMGTKTMRAPIVNFIGLSGSGLPPDPSGAAGPNHYVQAVNTSFRVFTKTGSVVPQSTFSLSTLWPGSTNEGDPIVLYDKHADRWFISQFQFSPNRILIAISETNDPTGSYYAYSFTLSQFPDYPKYSIWWDGYYMTSNSTHTAVVFERDKMLAGDPSAQMVSLSLPSLNSMGFKSPLSADADGDLPPNGTPCYFFNLEDNAFSGVSQDQIEIYEMTTDWNNTSNTQVASSQQLAVPSFDAIFSGNLDNIAQPGGTNKLDAIMGVLMFRAQHMRWWGYNTIVLSHAVDLGSNRSGIRWYELRDANDGNWSVYQSGTYAPDTKSRWMSSAAMDNWGNIGIGYSLTDATSTYPSLAYTGRMFYDPAGQMSMGEQIAMSGSGIQTITNRFGDYAHLSLDPDGKTFWYTGEYMAGNDQPKTRIFSFSLYDESAEISENGHYYSDLSMVAFQNGSDLHVKAEGVYNNENVKVELIGMNGQTVFNSDNIKPTEGSVDYKFTIPSVQSGVYFVRLGNGNFQKVEKIVLKN